jgi:hypothetical protein
MTWLEIHGEAPTWSEHWRGFIEAAGAYEGEAEPAAGETATAAAQTTSSSISFDAF